MKYLFQGSNVKHLYCMYLQVTGSRCTCNYYDVYFGCICCNNCCWNQHDFANTKIFLTCFHISLFQWVSCMVYKNLLLLLVVTVAFLLFACFFYFLFLFLFVIHMYIYIYILLLLLLMFLLAFVCLKIPLTSELTLDGKKKKHINGWVVLVLYSSSFLLFCISHLVSLLYTLYERERERESE